MQRTLCDAAPSANDGGSNEQRALAQLLARQQEEWPQTKGISRVISALSWGRRGGESEQHARDRQTRLAHAQEWAQALGAAGFAPAGHARVQAWAAPSPHWDGGEPGSFSIHFFAAPESGRVVMLDGKDGVEKGTLSEGLKDPEERFWMRKLEEAHELGHLAFGQRPTLFEDGGLLRPEQRDALEAGIFGHLAGLNWAMRCQSEAFADAWGCLALLWGSKNAPGAQRAVEQLMAQRRLSAFKDADLAWEGVEADDRLRSYYHTEAAIKMAIAEPGEWINATPQEIEERAARCASAGMARALRPSKPYFTRHGEKLSLGGVSAKSFAGAWDASTDPGQALIASAACWRVGRRLASSLTPALAQSAAGQWMQKHEAALHAQLSFFAASQPQGPIAIWRSDESAFHNAAFDRLHAQIALAARAADPSSSLAGAMKRESESLKGLAIGAWDAFVEQQSKAMAQEAQAQAQRQARISSEAIQAVGASEGSPRPLAQTLAQKMGAEKGVQDIMGRLSAQRMAREEREASAAPPSGPGVA